MASNSNERFVATLKIEHYRTEQVEQPLSSTMARSGFTKAERQLLGHTHLSLSAPMLASLLTKLGLHIALLDEDDLTPPEGPTKRKASDA